MSKPHLSNQIYAPDTEFEMSLEHPAMINNDIQPVSHIEITGDTDVNNSVPSTIERGNSLIGTDIVNGFADESFELDEIICKATKHEEIKDKSVKSGNREEYHELLHIASSSCCRICQLTSSEDEEELRTTGCRCQGTLCVCHQSCLQRWVNEQQSDRCEICKIPFSRVSIPEPRSEEPENTRTRLQLPEISIMHQIQVCMLDRRGLLWLLFWVLILVVAVTSYLTHWTSKIYDQMLNDPLVPRSELDKANLMFASSLFVLTVSCAMVISLMCLSCVACCSSICEEVHEVDFQAHRRQLGRQLINGDITAEEFWAAYFSFQPQTTRMPLNRIVRA